MKEAPFVALANGIDADRAAVDAALTMRWSNGPAEGHINRVKLIKRQGYGRAKLDLLRARVLAAESPVQLLRMAMTRTTGDGEHN